MAAWSSKDIRPHLEKLLRVGGTPEALEAFATHILALLPPDKSGSAGVRLRGLLESIFDAAPTDPDLQAARAHLGWTDIPYKEIWQIASDVGIKAGSSPLANDATAAQLAAHRRELLANVTVRRVLAGRELKPPHGLDQKTVKEARYPAIVSALLNALEGRLSSIGEAPSAAIDSTIRVEQPPQDAIEISTHRGKRRPRRWRFNTAVLLLFAVALIAPRLLPASALYPIKATDQVLNWTIGPLALLLVWMYLRHAFHRTPPGRWMKTTVLILLVLFCVVGSVLHLASYYGETKDARLLSADSEGRRNVLVDDFNGEGNCPSEELGDKAKPRPLTDCRLSGGRLVATLSSPDPAFGAYARHATPISTTTITGEQNDQLEPVPFYLETRFRPLGTRIFDCGLLFEGPAGMDFIRLARRDESFVAVAAQYPGPGSATSRLERVAVGDDILPFVRRASWPGANYATWTKIAVLINGHDTAVFVNDRFALKYRDPDRGDILRATVAVSASSVDYSAATASCEFDYLHFYALPSDLSVDLKVSQ